MNEPWRGIHECTLPERLRRRAVDALEQSVELVVWIMVTVPTLFVAVGVPCYILMKVFT